jgi:hypothetical protein
MGTVLIYEPNLSLSVTESDEIFAEETDAKVRLRLGELDGETCRRPVATEYVPHRCFRANLGQ